MSKNLNTNTQPHIIWPVKQLFVQPEMQITRRRQGADVASGTIPCTSEISDLVIDAPGSCYMYPRRKQMCFRQLSVPRSIAPASWYVAMERRVSAPSRGAPLAVVDSCSPAGLAILQEEVPEQKPRCPEAV